MNTLDRCGAQAKLDLPNVVGTPCYMAPVQSQGFLDYSAVVERKEGTGLMRIGISRLMVKATS